MLLAWAQVATWLRHILRRIRSSNRRAKLVKWEISIAIVLRIVSSTFSLVGSGRRSIVLATMAPSVSVAAIHYKYLRSWMTHICVIRSNGQGVERRIYASFKHQRDNFSHTCLLRNFPQMFFISRPANPENFKQIYQKRFELWSLVANHLTRPRLQDFFKKS